MKSKRKRGNTEEKDKTN